MKYKRHLFLASVISLVSIFSVPAGAQTQGPLGARIRDMHPRGSPPKKPVLIAYAVPDGPVEKAGLHIGDVVTSMDGIALDGTTAWVAQVGKHIAGDKVHLTVTSGSAAPRTIELTVGPNIDIGPAFPTAECLYGYPTLYVGGYMGQYVKGMFVHDADFVVSAIMPGAEIARAGVVAQDQILAIDGVKVTKVEDLYASSYAPGEIIRVKYARAGKTKEVSVAVGCIAWPPLPGRETKIWSEMKDKPPLPEIVNRERVLAENSLAEKNLFAAWLHYGKGLAAYPFWPEGWYNSALVAKEMQLWGYAALEMNQYLALAPNASDAQAARDQIIIWEEKAKETTPAATGSR